MVSRYLDSNNVKNMFRNVVPPSDDYIVFNTTDDLAAIAKDFKGSLNIFQPDLYLKMKKEKKFDLDNYV